MGNRNGNTTKMIFQEKKIENGYIYEVEDVFGNISIESDTKIKGDILDDMVVLLLKKNLSAEIINGEIKHKDGVVKYTFKRAPIWSEDEEEKNQCENSPTSIKKQEKEFIQTIKSKILIWSWFKKFAVAFREAWKKQNKKNGR